MSAFSGTTASNHDVPATTLILSAPTTPPPSSSSSTLPSAQTSRHTPDMSPTESPPRTTKKNKQSLDYILRSGLAGGVAGCAAKTLIAPLDRVKILFQTSNKQFIKHSGSWMGLVRATSEIYTQDGASGLFRGHSMTLLRIFPYAAIKFVAYEQIRAIFIKSKEQETGLRRLLCGSLAGVTSVFFTYPLDVVRVRLAFETRKDYKGNVFTIFRDIYREHPNVNVRGSVAAATAAASSTGPTAASSAGATTAGAAAASSKYKIAQTAPTAAPSTVTKPFYGIANFYRGFSATVLGMLPYAGVSFLTHDLMGDWLRSERFARYAVIPNTGSSQQDEKEAYSRVARPTLKVWAELVAGGFAGLCSQTASYPLEVLRRRMQVGGAVGSGKFLTMWETARLIMRERGLKGFYVGLTIGYLKVVPMAAASFFVYERAKIFLGI